MSRSSLDVLEKLKQQAVDESTNELSRRVGDAERAIRERAEAEDALARKQADVSRVQTLEEAKLESGELSVCDLTRGAEYRQGVRIEQGEAERNLTEAQARERKRRAALEVAQGALAEARAEEKAVHKLVEERRMEVRAAKAAAEELDAEDLHNARRGATTGNSRGEGAL